MLLFLCLDNHDKPRYEPKKKKNQAERPGVIQPEIDMSFGDAEDDSLGRRFVDVPQTNRNECD